MAMSDAFERTAEMRRDVLAIEATVGQLVQIQQQMQLQTQQQMQQQTQLLQHVVQLHEDGIKQRQAKLDPLAEERDKLEERTVAMGVKVERLMAKMSSFETAIAEVPIMIQQKVTSLEGKIKHEASMMDSKLDGALAKRQGQIDARSRESNLNLKSLQLLPNVQAQVIQETQLSASASSASASDLCASVQSLAAKIESMEAALAETRSVLDARLCSLEAKRDHEMSKVDSKLEEATGRIQNHLGAYQEGFEPQIRKNEASASGTISALKNSLVAKFEQLERRVEPALSGVDAAVETSDLNDENAERAPAPAQDVLSKAIRGQQSQEALDLLKLKEVPGLNDTYDCSTLTRALAAGLPEVALAIVKRPDFKQINSKPWSGWTCLHSAAGRGYLEVVQAILERSDFCGLKAETTCASWGTPAGSSALDMARTSGHQEIVCLIESKLQET